MNWDKKLIQVEGEEPFIQWSLRLGGIRPHITCEVFESRRAGESRFGALANITTDHAIFVICSVKVECATPEEAAELLRVRLLGWAESIVNDVVLTSDGKEES